MNGPRGLSRRLTALTKAAMAVALVGGFLTVVVGSSPADAFSSTPSWFTTAGAPAATLTCGTWYTTTMGAQTGGGSATITIIGGGAGGGAGTPVAVGNTANSAVGGAGGSV